MRGHAIVLVVGGGGEMINEAGSRLQAVPGWD